MVPRSWRWPSPRRVVALPRVGGVLAIVAILLVPESARADEKTDCLDAHGEAQLLRRNGRLRAARTRLIGCSTASCPVLVSRDCKGWLNEAEAEQPTVVLAARDDAGRDVGAVRVTLDGEPVATYLDEILRNPAHRVVRNATRSDFS